MDDIAAIRSALSDLHLCFEQKVSQGSLTARCAFIAVSAVSAGRRPL